VLVPLGRLSGAQVDALADAASVGQGRLIVTPWRGMLVPDLPSPVALTGLIGQGLIADDGSGWRGVTACPGSRCARGAGDTDGPARQVAARPGRSTLLPVHVVACSRGCGQPSGRHVLALITRSGVEIRCDDRAVHAGADEAADIVGALREGAR